MKTSVRTRRSKMETRVAGLLTILISLLAVYQLNCLLMLLSITTFQRRKAILSSVMDSSPEVIRRSFVKRRRAYRRYWVRPGRIREHSGITFWVGLLLMKNWRRILRCAKRIFINWRTASLYIEKQTTVMRSPVKVERQVALTLYYLSDEGRLRKTASQCIWVI